MERSSPLAAMQPPSMMGHWGYQSDIHKRNVQYPSFDSFGPNSFNFRDLSMKKPSSGDYFTLKPLRGSSPTSSLAADLSQNFHIDQSPQLPTPRKSLFSANIFSAMNNREPLLTPPPPSSSPVPVSDSMDVSPLPHKVPRALEIQIRDDPSRAEISPTSVSGFTPTQNKFHGGLSGPLKQPPQERRKHTLLRPSLTRTKGFSTNTVVKPAGTAGLVPPFTFGTAAKPQDASPLPLGECFSQSPQQPGKAGTAAQAPTSGMMATSRPKQPFWGSGANVRNGSPVAGHVRKQSAPIVRPRKQFRRSLSMFEHPDDVMRSEQNARSPAATLAAVMDADETPALCLPYFVPDDEPDSLPRISKTTLIDVLDGKYQESCSDTLIVDCRFEYEYEGGHIDGAVNFNNKELLASKIFECGSQAPTMLIFHCEYSAHRAPIMAKFIRGRDRAINHFRYPQLTFPEVYILDGGYSGFFEDHRERCFPQNYVEMGAKEHAETCEREMGRLRRKKLSRAQTFAFGQSPNQVQDSPTAQGRSKDESMMDVSSPYEHPDPRRSISRRMASY
ncbi:MAG: hypothetical protein M1825_001703 [Sarcosagium campestre]|nr:MAG: hypothetical protein M1825_001703 [Sarcosagium campestre]